MSNKLLVAIFASALVWSASCGIPQNADAKKWTVTERIVKLSGEIDQGRKANELTTKQVESLKKMVDKINQKMEKMKTKNGGKLSVPDTKTLHDDMTDVSVKMYKMRMDNVYSN